MDDPRSELESMLSSSIDAELPFALERKYVPHQTGYQTGYPAKARAARGGRRAAAAGGGERRAMGGGSRRRRAARGGRRAAEGGDKRRTAVEAAGGGERRAATAAAAGTIAKLQPLSDLSVANVRVKMDSKSTKPSLRALMRRHGVE